MSSIIGILTGHMSSILKYVETEEPLPDTQFWNRASDPVLLRDPFSSLMWVLFCLPFPLLTCEESLVSLIHVFYAVSIAQVCWRHSIFLLVKLYFASVVWFLDPDSSDAGYNCMLWDTSMQDE